MSRREESKRRTRAALLGAARKVIRDKGSAATTARDVASEAEVAVGTAFAHFPSMGALAETLPEKTVGEALTAVGVLPREVVAASLFHVAGLRGQSDRPAPARLLRSSLHRLLETN